MNVVRRVKRWLIGRRLKPLGVFSGLYGRLGVRLAPDGQPLGKSFRRIVVVPGQQDPSHRWHIDGGPIWPQYQRQTWVRLLREKRVFDNRPKFPDGQIVALNDDMIWGGRLQFHFGHLCAEHITRLLWSLHRWPGRKVLFISHEGKDASSVPDYAWDVLGWMGLPKEQVIIVTQPVRVGRLLVMPQAEWIRGAAPPRSYLKLLNAHVNMQGLTPIISDVLYVSRVGMITRGGGVQGGEAYLERLLRAAGVAVMDPANTPLRQQLARYAGARVIVFAEGSAVHGRQLLGRIDQDIHILNRRQSRPLAKRGLIPRVRRLRYVRATGHCADLYQHDGRRNTTHALSFYDVPTLIAGFKVMGVDLAHRWNDADYRSELASDVAIFLKRLESCPASISRDKTLAAMHPILMAENLAHLLPQMKGTD